MLKLISCEILDGQRVKISNYIGRHFFPNDNIHFYNLNFPNLNPSKDITEFTIPCSDIIIEGNDTYIIFSETFTKYTQGFIVLPDLDSLVTYLGTEISPSPVVLKADKIKIANELIYGFIAYITGRTILGDILGFYIRKGLFGVIDDTPFVSVDTLGTDMDGLTATILITASDTLSISCSSAAPDSGAIVYWSCRLTLMEI